MQTSRLTTLVRVGLQNARYMPGGALAMTVDALGCLTAAGALPAGCVAPPTARQLTLAVADNVQDMSPDDVVMSLCGLTRLGLSEPQMREHLLKHYLRANQFSAVGVIHLVESLEGLTEPVAKQVFAVVLNAATAEMFAGMPGSDASRLVCSAARSGVLELLAAHLPTIIRAMSITDLVALCPVFDTRGALPAFVRDLLPLLAERVSLSSDGLTPTDLSKFFKLFCNVAAAAPEADEALKPCIANLQARLLRDVAHHTVDDISRTLEALASRGSAESPVLQPLLARLYTVMPDTRAPHLVAIVESLARLGYGNHRCVKIAERRAAALVREFPAPLAIRFLHAMPGVAKADGPDRDSFVAPPQVIREFASYFVPVCCTDSRGNEQTIRSLVIRIPTELFATERNPDDHTIRSTNGKEHFELRRVQMGTARLEMLAAFFHILAPVLPRSEFTINAGALLMASAAELPTATLVSVLASVAAVASLHEGASAQVLVKSMAEALEAKLPRLFHDGDVEMASRVFASLVLLASADASMAIALSKALAQLATQAQHFQGPSFVALVEILAGLFPNGALRAESPYLLQTLEARSTETFLRSLQPHALIRFVAAMAKLESKQRLVAEVFVSRVLVAESEAACIFASFDAAALRELIFALSSAVTVIQEAYKDKPDAIIHNINWRAIGAAPVVLAHRVAATGKVSHPLELIQVLESFAAMGMYTCDANLLTRVPLTSEFFTTFAVRFVMVSSAITPKFALAVLSALERFGSVPLCADVGVNPDTHCPEAPLLRCVFSRCREIGHTATPNEAQRIAKHATSIARHPRLAQMIPEAANLQHAQTTQQVVVANAADVQAVEPEFSFAASMEAAVRSAAKPGQDQPPVQAVAQSMLSAVAPQELPNTPELVPASPKLFVATISQPAAPVQQEFDDHFTQVFASSAKAMGDDGTMAKRTTSPSEPPRLSIHATSQQVPTVAPTASKAADLPCLDQDEPSFDEPAFEAPKTSSATSYTPPLELHNKFSIAHSPNLLLHFDRAAARSSATATMSRAHPTGVAQSAATAPKGPEPAAPRPWQTVPAGLGSLVMD
jgi:hypothetical protein